MLTDLKIHSVIESLDDTGTPEGEPEINITTHRANMRRDGDILHLSYKEEQEGVDISCHITVYPDGKVSLSRRGGIISDILFSEGEECSTVYTIPPYRFDMTVSTLRVELSMCGAPIRIRIIYTMNIGGQRRRTSLTVTAGKANEAK